MSFCPFAQQSLHTCSSRSRTMPAVLSLPQSWRYAAHSRSPLQQRRTEWLASSSGRSPHQAARPCCLGGVAHPEQECGDDAGVAPFSSSLSAPLTSMARGRLGGKGSGATLERSKFKFATRQQVHKQAPKLDNDGSGGNNGKNIFNGGGGGDEGDDDDDYFGDFDGGGDGDSDKFFRAVIEQLYTPEAINAVLQEWSRSVGSLPAIIRQSVQLGLFSSAQLVRFLSMDVRPGMTRTVTRSLPPGISRGVVGRLMADPAFMQKLLIEQVLTIGSSMAWEWQQRGQRMRQELDLAAINTLCLAAGSAAMVWMSAPTRSHGSLGKMPWQAMLHAMPNNVFDASTPLRNYNGGTRAGAFAVKLAELCAVGTLTGLAMGGLTKAAVALRRRSDPSFESSVPVRTVGQASSGMALAGVYQHVRLQAIGGLDRWFFDHATSLVPYLVMSAAARLGSNWAVNLGRLRAMGLPTAVPQRQRLAPAMQQQVQRPPQLSSAKQAAGKRQRRVKGFEMSISNSGGALPAGSY